MGHDFAWPRGGSAIFAVAGAVSFIAATVVMKAWEPILIKEVVALMPPRSRKSVGMVVLVVLTAVLGGVALAFLANPEMVDNLLRERTSLGNETRHGTLPAMLVVSGEPFGPEGEAVPLAAPPQTATVVIVVTLPTITPQLSPTFQVVLEQHSEGRWLPLEKTHGRIFALLSHTGDLSEADLRLRVAPVEDGAYAAQQFRVSAEYWS